VLAVLGAASLVAIAVVARGVIDGDDDPAAGSGDGERVVVCAVDLRDACDAMSGVEVRFATAGATATSFGAGEVADDVDAWITTSAWVEVIETRAPGSLGQAEAVASSDVAVGVVPDRAGAVDALCDGRTVWRCLGDDAGRGWGELGGETSWGPLRTGLPAADSAVGLPILASAASGYFGHLDFAANDFAELRGWLADLADASGGGERDPLGVMVTRIGSYSAAGTTAAQLETITRPVEGRATAPPVAATVVAVPVPGRDGLPDLGPLRDALADDGWTAVDGSPPPPTLKPGVMAALHTLWTEITR
jgi:hypothetical protein